MKNGDPEETRLKVDCFVCPASTPLQMPQYFKNYAPGAGISKHKNIFVFIEKNTSTIIVEESMLANIKQVYSKGLETKRELQDNFLKHLIIF